MSNSLSVGAPPTGGQSITEIGIYQAETGESLPVLDQEDRSLKTGFRWKGDNWEMKRQRRSTLAIALCLYLLLFSVYMLVYSGLFYSWDCMSRFCVTESLVTRDAFDTPQIWGGLFGFHRFGRDGEYYSKYGIFPSLLAVPLYWIALHIKRLGLAQAVILLNAFITAVTGSLILLYVKGLGYSRNASLLVGLIFGLCTTALVYSKYFFSEPILSLCLLATAYVLFRRKSNFNKSKRSSGYALLAGLILGLAMATNLIALLAIPVFFFYGFYRHTSKAAIHTRRYLIDILFFGLSLGISLVAIGVYNYARFGSPLQSGYPSWEKFDTPLLIGLWGLLLSPEKGLVFYSPVLLLFPFSFFAFFKRNRAEAMLALALFIIYCVTYAQWHDWGGGVCWGPRFLVPLIPFLMITTAPTIEALLAQRSSLTTLAFLALCLLSAIVQILGAGVNSGDIDYRLTLIAQRLPFNPLRWRILGHAFLFRLQDLDFAWARTVGQTNFDAVAVSVTVALVLFSITTLVYLSRHDASQRAVVVLLAGSLFLPASLSWFCLSRYYFDPLFLGGDDYHALLDYLPRVSEPQDVLVLDNHFYTKFFLNYNKAPLKWYTLSGDEFPPEVRKSALLDSLLDRYPRIWLVDDSVPSLGLPRPIEQYLSERSYKIDEVAFSNYSRLCLYSAAHQPDSESPQFVTELNLGHSISLLGYDLFPSTADILLRSGDVIHLSLLWQALAPIEQDYTVFVHMLDENGQLCLQVDRYPVDGFRPTSLWSLGEKVRDNYGLVIPPEMPPGRYHLVAGMYWLETLERLPVTSHEAVRLGDYVLLGEITVAP